MTTIDIMFVVAMLLIMSLSILEDKTSILTSRMNLIQLVLYIATYPFFAIVLLSNWVYALSYIGVILLSLVAYFKANNIEKQTLTAVLDQVNNHHNYKITEEEHLKHINYGWNVSPHNLIKKFKQKGSIPNTVELH